MSNYAKYKDLGGGENNDSFNTGKSSSESKGVQQPNTQQPEVSPIIEIQSLEHKKHLLASGNKVFVVKVYANWCQPCKQIASRCSQIASKYLSQVPPGMFIFAQENSDLKISNVKGVPTFQFFKDGKYINEDLVGADVAAVDKKIFELLRS
jgi:thiol-disulfide isomerase/thioredoxin